MVTYQTFRTPKIPKMRNLIPVPLLKMRPRDSQSGREKSDPINTIQRHIPRAYYQEERPGHQFVITFISFLFLFQRFILLFS